MGVSGAESFNKAPIVVLRVSSLFSAAAAAVAVDFCSFPGEPSSLNSGDVMSSSDQAELLGVSIELS